MKPVRALLPILAAALLSTTALAPDHPALCPLAAGAAGPDQGAARRPVADDQPGRTGQGGQPRLHRRPEGAGAALFGHHRPACLHRAGPGPAAGSAGAAAGRGAGSGSGPRAGAAGLAGRHPRVQRRFQRRQLHRQPGLDLAAGHLDRRQERAAQRHQGGQRAAGRGRGDLAAADAEEQFRARIRADRRRQPGPVRDPGVSGRVEGFRLPAGLSAGQQPGLRAVPRRPLGHHPGGADHQHRAAAPRRPHPPDLDPRRRRPDGGGARRQDHHRGQRQRVPRRLERRDAGRISAATSPCARPRA